MKQTNAKKLSTSLLFLLFLSIFSITFVFSTNQASAENTQEKLLGLTVDHDGINFQVYSGGCTQKSDFSIMILQMMPPKLILIRKKPDYCEAYLPYGTIINFKYSEIGIQSGSHFSIGNSFVDLY
ncbi:MAG: hypothetical protein HQK49_03535 [Oligoflexia bacterium]|nr:hypothetical protein [Oligoflexia bacterium]